MLPASSKESADEEILENEESDEFVPVDKLESFSPELKNAYQQQDDTQGLYQPKKTVEKELLN
jgi:hypothetical protein